ncbi:MAG: hypothetical protein Q9174_005487 [Haloplaca sp. 1 TL-2023]
MHPFARANASLDNSKPFHLSNISLDYIRYRYGDKKPSFAREIRPGQLEVGQRREVVVATSTGKYPQEAPVEAVVEAWSWNDKYCFWTVEIMGQRFIVVSRGGTAYRRWLGISEKNSEEEFENRNYLFAVVEPRTQKDNDINATEPDDITKDQNRSGSKGKPQSHGSSQLPPDISRTTDPRDPISTASITENALTRLDKINVYSATEILKADRIFYASRRPEFIQRDSSKIFDGPIRVELIAEDGRDLARYIKIYPRAWDKKSIYWVTTWKGQVRILQRCAGGRGGSHYRLWRGHDLQTDGEAVAKPLSDTRNEREIEARTIVEPSPLELLDKLEALNTAPLPSEPVALRPSNALAPGRRPTRMSDLPPPRDFGIDGEQGVDANNSVEQPSHDVRGGQADVGAEVETPEDGVRRSSRTHRSGTNVESVVQAALILL